MIARRLILVSAGLGVSVLACILIAREVVRLWYPTLPRRPTQTELLQIESRFPAVRGSLERIVLTYQEANLREARDSLAAMRETGAPGAAGDPLKVQRLERRVVELEHDVDARLAQIPIARRPRGHDILCSDSLIYLAAWTRQGHGFSAPSNAAGYVYASRDPADPAAWPLLGSEQRSPIGLPLLGHYKHLQGRWYLYSIREY